MIDPRKEISMDRGGRSRTKIKPTEKEPSLSGEREQPRHGGPTRTVTFTPRPEKVVEKNESPKREKDRERDRGIYDGGR